MGASSSEKKVIGNKLGIINSDNFKITNNLSQNTVIDVNNSCKNFFESPHEIQSFYDEEKIDDPAFNTLIKKEQKILNKEIDKLRDPFIKEFKNLLKVKTNKKKTNKKLVKKLIEYENGKEVFQRKIENCINQIKNNENEIAIDYLTVYLVGKSGVGKSTLINEVLRLKKEDCAEEGIGQFITKETKPYKSDSMPFLRLVDSRGIELNKKYGPKQVKKDAEEFIIGQKETNDPNKFVQCIWYCLTGDRFEDSEIELLNSLREAYEESKIPIILIYTQATNKNLVEGMKKYIKEKNIEGNFMKVLARKIKLCNDKTIKSFGLPELIRETIKRCKKAIKGDMFSVIIESISKTIYKLIEEKNKSDKNSIIKEMKLSFLENFGFFSDQDIFIKFIIHLFSFNIKIFFERSKTQQDLRRSF